MSLLNAVAEKQSIRTAAAMQRYYEILESGDESLAEQLLELAMRLGKSEADIAHDSRVIMGFNHAAALHATGNAKVGEHAAAEKAAQTFRAETEALIASRQQIQARLDQEELELSTPVNIGVRQLEHMLEMKKKNPDLLRHKHIPGY